jgi:type II secretion system protein H
MRSRPANRSGFTLVELMIVLILIGIFSALMLGEMRGTYEDALLRTTARKVISTASLANSQAVTSQRTHSLLVEPGRIRIQTGSASEPIEDEKLDSRIQIAVREALPDDEELADEREPEPKTRLENIRYLPDGTADRREIVLRDRMGVELTLQVNPVNGRIRIIEQEVRK